MPAAAAGMEDAPATSAGQTRLRASLTLKGSWLCRKLFRDAVPPKGRLRF
jgi:hypothetical protein